MKKITLLAVAVLLVATSALAGCGGCNKPSATKEDKEFTEKYLSPEQIERAKRLEEEAERKMKEVPDQRGQSPQPSPPPDNASNDNNSLETKGGKVYTISNYPKNPKTPGEAVAAYFCLTARLEYEKAKASVSSGCQNEFPSKTQWEQEVRSFSQQFQGIKIEEEYEQGDDAYVRAAIFYKNGGSWRSSFSSVKENGIWKFSK